MGHYVHTSAIFSCDGYKGIADFAREYAAKLDRSRSYSEDAAGRMLNYLAGGNGVSEGPKAGLFCWGETGNYTDGEEFVEALREFFHEVYRRANASDGFEGPLHFEHILVFIEPEQSEAAQAFEISYDEGTDTLSVKHHERLPFAWMQF